MLAAIAYEHERNRKVAAYPRIAEQESLKASMQKAGMHAGR